MSKKSSCCCGYLSGLWWWLLTLTGLPLLFFAMITQSEDALENDLTHRVNSQLVAEKADWAIANLSKRGRDVQLSGNAVSQAERERALAVAASVPGVRVVEDLTAITPMVAPTLALQTLNGKLALQGVLASDDEVQRLLAAAGKVWPSGETNNQLSVGERVESADWLAGIADFLPVLQGVTGASLDVSAEEVKLGGTVYSDEVYGNVLGKAQALFGDRLNDQIVVEALSPAFLQAALENDKLVLRGNLPAQAQADSLLAVASQQVGADKVVNELNVSQDFAAAEWLDAAGKLLGLLPQKQGKLTIEQGTLEISGEMDSDAAHNALVPQLNAVLAGSGLNLVDHLQVGGAQAQQVAPTKQATPVESDPVVASCQTRLNDTIQNQQILFETNQAVIKQESLPVVDALVKVMLDCNAAISQRGIRIGGHTDSVGNDAYNQALSQRRASAVKDYLVSAGVEGRLVESVGFGESEPVASNDTEEGRALNRRISFEIKR